MRPPHKLLAGMWREADAVIGALGALRDAEQAVAALTTNPAAPLTEIAAIAWAFEAPDGTAAIAQSLARLRGTDRTRFGATYLSRAADRVGTGDPTWGSARRQTPCRPALSAARAAAVKPPSASTTRSPPTKRPRPRPISGVPPRLRARPPRH